LARNFVVESNARKAVDVLFKIADNEVTTANLPGHTQVEKLLDIQKPIDVQSKKYTVSKLLITTYTGICSAGGCNSISGTSNLVISGVKNPIIGHVTEIASHI